MNKNIKCRNFLCDGRIFLNSLQERPQFSGDIQIVKEEPIIAICPVCKREYKSSEFAIQNGKLKYVPQETKDGQISSYEIDLRRRYNEPQDYLRTIIS